MELLRRIPDQELIWQLDEAEMLLFREVERLDKEMN